MTSLLVLLYGFLAIFMGFTGYCLVAVAGTALSEPRELDFSVSDPSPAR